jgi:hypothetical protein
MVEARPDMPRMDPALLGFIAHGKRRARYRAAEDPAARDLSGSPCVQLRFFADVLATNSASKRHRVALLFVEVVLSGIHGPAMAPPRRCPELIVFIGLLCDNGRGIAS